MALKVQAPDGVKVSCFIAIAFEVVLEGAARRPRPMHVVLRRRLLSQCATRAFDFQHTLWFKRTSQAAVKGSPPLPACRRCLPPAAFRRRWRGEQVHAV